MTTTLRTVETDELIDLSDHHPLVRHLAPHRVEGYPSWAFGRAVALFNGYWAKPEDHDVMVIGPPDDAATLATTLAHELARPLSLPAEAFALLDEGLLTETFTWGFRWVDEPLGADPAAAQWLTPGDDAEITGLLDSGFPDASMRPGSPRVQGWAGVRSDEGRLVAVAADTTETPGVGFVASITAVPALRGTGLGRRVTGWLLDRLVEREGQAALWHYGGNHAAAGLYDALGMRSLPMAAGRPVT